MLPIPPPQLIPAPPTPCELAEHPNGELLVLSWELDCGVIRQENMRQFQRALSRMKRCAWLRKFLRLSKEGHFSWCPHEHWGEFWYEAELASVRDEK